MSALLPACILIPLATSLLLAMTSQRPRLQLALSSLGAAAFLCCAGLLFWLVAREGTVEVTFGGWPAPYGISFIGDLLGAGMILMVAVMGTIALVFQRGDVDRAPESPYLLPLVHALLAAVSGAFATGDLFNLYVWFELALVAALGLLVYRVGRPHLEVTLKYFVLNAVGTLFLLVGVAYLYAATGQLSFRALAQASQQADVNTLLPFVVMVALAFLVKAGAFPLFAWLPASYHSLPAPLLALFAGLLSKVGVYALLRLLGVITPGAPEVLFVGLKWVAAATMVVGVFGAAYHWDIRRLLAFHSISQIGYMLLGIALNSRAGQAGAVLFIVHHFIVKSNLFLCGALIYHFSGSYDLRRSGGLYNRHPGLALIFGISAMSLVGIPPFTGFWAKLLVLRAAFGQGEYLLGGVALFVGLLTLYSMVKIWFQAFCKPHPNESFALSQARWSGPAWVATLILTLLTVGFGLMPDSLVRFAQLSVESFGGAP